MATTEIWNGAHTDGTFSHADNWVSDDSPDTGDSALFPAIAAASTVDVDGGDMSAILLVDFLVEPNCGVNFGSRSSYLHLDTDYLYFRGSGYGFLQIDNSTAVYLNAGRSGSSSTPYGMNLLGASNALLQVDVGSGNTVGLATVANETAAFTTVVVNSGTVWIGDQLTATNLIVNGGTVRCASAVTNIYCAGGTVTIDENAPTNLYGTAGTIYYNAGALPSGTINLDGVTLSLAQNPASSVTGTIDRFTRGTIINTGGKLASVAGLIGGTISLS